MTTSALRLRDGVQGLVAYSRRDLDALFSQVTSAQLAEAALRDVLPALVRTYGLAAGSLAADWYDLERERAGARKAFSPIVPDLGDAGSQALVGWATATATGFDPLKALIAGGLQRRIANYSRETVTGSAVADPGSAGWQRVGNGNCDFCEMLIGRGAVYSEASSDFQCHDNCRCSAEPVWS
jgi:hypothetical protein